MSRFLNNKKIYWFLIAAGIVFYIANMVIVFESKAGICMEVRSPSGSSTRRDAVIGFEEDGLKKSVFVKIGFGEDIKPGASVLISKKILGYDLEKQISPALKNTNILFYGQTSRSSSIGDLPLGGLLSVVVEQDNVRKTYSFIDRYYYVELDKAKPATLHFSCDGYNQKRLDLVFGDQLTSSVFKANVVFNEGSGIEYKMMNLDSIEASQNQE